MNDMICGDTFDEVYSKLLWKLSNDPDFVCAPREMKIKECLGLTIRLKNPRARLLSDTSRKPNYGFAVGEFLWYFRGDDDLESMLYYNKRMGNYSNDGKTINSAYGKRIFGPQPRNLNYKISSQWDNCIEELKKDRHSRRAILNINEKWDNFDKNSKDVPCTMHLQFFIRDDKLYLHVVMRSNDCIWGLTADLFSFTLLQECMLDCLKVYYPNLSLGEYIHTAGSMHLYEQHFEMAEKTIAEYNEPGNPMYPMDHVTVYDLWHLLDEEIKLRLGKIDQIKEDEFSGGVKWMCRQLNIHRNKRDKENG